MKMTYVEAPNTYRTFYLPERSIFLGGSITGAWDWQKEAANKLLPHFNCFNPRRANYSTFDPKVELEQITWEHKWLGFCGILLFYFSHETLAPITLLEYGAALESTKCQSRFHKQKVYVCIHPDYKRKNDVVIQTKLRNDKWSKNIRYDLNEALDLIIKENS